MLDSFVYFFLQSDCLRWCGRKDGSGKKLLLCMCIYAWRFLMSENFHPVNVSLASKSFF